MRPCMGINPKRTGTLVERFFTYMPAGERLKEFINAIKRLVAGDI